MQNKLDVMLQSPDSIQCLRLIKKIEEGDTTTLWKTLRELGDIIDGEYSAEVHTQALWLLKQLFLLGREDLVKRVGEELLPRIVRVVEGAHNPEMYFLDKPRYRGIVDDRQREQLRKSGIEYISHCLESVRTWADWVKFTPEGYRSVFSDAADRLASSGVKFPEERVLYKEVDREKFERVYKMEFFNSESEFEDSVLNESNVETLVTRELNQCDQVLQGLRFELKPVEQQTNWKQVKNLLDRASIFFHEQSVKLIQELRALPQQKDMLSTLLDTQSVFGSLAQDYEFYRAGKMPYQQFYRKYGQIEREKPFQKPPQSLRSQDATKRDAPSFSIDNIPLQFEPMSVDVSHSMKTSMKKRALNNPTEPQMVTDHRQLTTQQEPFRQQYRLQLDQLKNEYEQKLATERQQANRRVDEVKRMVNVNSTELKEEWLKRLESENQQFRKRYEELMQQLKDKETQNDRLRMQMSDFEEQLKERTSQLEEREDGYRRVADQLGRMKKLHSQQEETLTMLRVQSNGKDRNRELSAPVDAPAASQRESDLLSTTSRKFEKRIDNLQQEVLILREQLEAERKKNYRESDVELQLLKEENSRLKQSLSKLEDSEAKQRLRIDILQVENLKMQESLKIKSTLSDSLRKENEWMVKTINHPQLVATTTTVRPLTESLSRQGFAPQKKLTIREYLEPSLEGDTYYQQLTREFKVHFRRACFKRKELLFKQSNIELGVITQRKALDHINCAVFLTNQGSRDLQQLRVKILNPVSNEITCEGSYFEVVLQGEQQKVYVDAKILGYPMGPFIMKLSYIDEDRDVSMQLLLPITIIKLVTYQNRATAIASPQRLLVRYDRKVLNSQDSLTTFFPGVDVSTDNSGTQRARMSVEHQHSQTTFDLDLVKDVDNIELSYGMQAGREEIMRYYIRILASLLEK